jgi:hypothetical protein
MLQDRFALRKSVRGERPGAQARPAARVGGTVPAAAMGVKKIHPRIWSFLTGCPFGYMKPLSLSDFSEGNPAA